MMVIKIARTPSLKASRRDFGTILLFRPGAAARD
jgi:hypothetical protein